MTEPEFSDDFKYKLLSFINGCSLAPKQLEGIEATVIAIVEREIEHFRKEHHDGCEEKRSSQGRRASDIEDSITDLEIRLKSELHKLGTDIALASSDMQNAYKTLKLIVAGMGVLIPIILFLFTKGN